MSTPSSSVAPRTKRPQPVPRLGHTSFQCSDCSISFPTHQALGGHRKFHTKLLGPNLRKPQRRKRRIPINNNAPNSAHPTATEINDKKPLEEEEEWHAVEVKINPDHARNGESKGKFIEFMETHSQQSSVVSALGVVDKTVKDGVRSNASTLVG